MIFGNLEFDSHYYALNDKIKRCFDYIKANDLKNFETGVYHIDGDDIFVNIVEYTTTAVENRFWESHQTYVDLHLMLNGTEQIDLNFVPNMTVKEFKENDDMYLLDGTKNSSVCLKNNDFLICFQEDAHCTGIQVEAPTAIKKAIFKIKIN